MTTYQSAARTKEMVMVKYKKLKKKIKNLFKWKKGHMEI